MALHETKASSPSSSTICTPFSSSSPAPPSPLATMAAHFFASASSMLRATCMSMAHGAALSMAPTNPSGSLSVSKWAASVRRLTSPLAAHGGSRRKMRFAKGTSSSPVAGVLYVELWMSTDHSGRFSWKKATKWFWAAREPAVPGMRGVRIGARSEPFSTSKSGSPEGMPRRTSSGSGA